MGLDADSVTDMCAVRTRRSCWSRRGWEWSTRSSKVPTRKRAASCKSSRKASMFRLHISTYFTVSKNKAPSICILQGAARQTRTSQAGPEGTRRDCGQLWAHSFTALFHWGKQTQIEYPSFPSARCHRTSVKRSFWGRGKTSVWERLWEVGTGQIEPSVCVRI